ncbi:MAG: rhodanese-like domain-containing protein [Comamonadaceae bacterium]
MIAQIRPSELSTWLQAARADGTPVVLDVREAAELRQASVKSDGFLLLTIPMSQLVARLDEIDPKQAIACLCHHGGRSMQVAAFLQSKGFSRVANIAGGINAWSDELDPNVPRY